MPKQSDQQSRKRARQDFLRVLAETGDYRRASAAARVSERTGRRWRQQLRRTPHETDCPIPIGATRCFVGRAAELEALDTLLQDTRRLVTVTGPPGIGKTRLVTEWLQTRGNLDGAEESPVFCDLRRIDSTASLTAELASGLGVQLSAIGEAAVDALGWIFRSRGTSLIVLDNFEQLTADGAAVVAQWLRRAPNLRFLITSRIRVALKSESVLEVGPLPVESVDRSPHDQLGPHCAGAGKKEPDPGSDATRLFLARAQIRDPALNPEALGRDDVVRLVRALDGVPLAIELAAAQLRTKDLGDIVAGLTDSGLRFEDPDRDADPRHKSLRTAIDRSWNLLDESERSMLRQLAVFRNGFTLEAARAVVRLPHSDRAVDDVLGSLRDASLVHAARATHGPRRWDLFEAIRHFALERLEQSKDEHSVRQRHAAHYRECGQVWMSELDSSHGVQTRARLSLERANLRAAYAWHSHADECELEEWLSCARALQQACAGTFPSEAIEITEEVARRVPEGSIPKSSPVVVYHSLQALLVGLRTLRECSSVDAAKSASAAVRSRIELGRRAGALSDGQATVLEAELNCEAGLLEFHYGSVTRARELLDRTVKRIEPCRAPLVEGRVRSLLAWVLAEGERDSRAFEHHAVAVECYRTSGDAYRETEARWLWGIHRLFFMRASESDGTVEEWEATTRRVDDRQARAFAAHALAIFHHSRRDWRDAETAANLAFCLAKQAGVRRLQGVAALTVATVLDAADREPLSTRARWFELARDVFADLGERRYEGLATIHLAGVQSRARDPEDANRLLDRARELLEPTQDRSFLELVELQTALLDLSRAEHALEARDESEATSWDQRVAQRVLRTVTLPSERRTPSLAHRCIEARNLLSIIRRERQRFDVRNHILRVSFDGQFFSLGARGDQPVPDGPVIRRVLLALVDERQRRPGTPLEASELLERAWSGERMIPEAGLRRVRDVVVRLRRLGLEDVVITSPQGGYLLDPSFPVFRASSAANQATSV